MIKLKLEKIVNTDKDGKDVHSVTRLKQVDGSIVERDDGISYIRHDAVVLSQLINSVDSKIIAVGEYPALIGLDDKCREALKKDSDEIGLTVDESALLKKLLNNPQNDRVSFSLFHIRTISVILEQLK